MGYMSNPMLPKPFRQPTVENTVSAQTEFDLPNFLDAQSTNIVYVFCNVTSTDLVIGNPSYLTVVLSLRSVLYRISGVQVIPHDTIEYKSYFEDTPSWGIPTVRRLDLVRISSDSLYTNYMGSDLVQFQAIGPLGMTIEFYMSPIESLWEMSNWTDFEHEFSKEVVFESIFIEPEKTIQQEINENLNLSLVYIVLFFASVEIAIAFYDHSEDKDKKAEYEKKKAEKKQYDNANPNQDIIY